MAENPERRYAVCGTEFVLEQDPAVFVPTSTSELIANTLKIEPGEVVIDLGCGSGFLSVLAAKCGASKVYAVDIMPEAAALTWRNAKRNGVESRIEVFTGSLFEPLPCVRADLVINDVSGVAEDVARATPWYPSSIPSGGSDGADPTVTMLHEAPQHLLPNGRLVFPVLSLANEQRILAEARRIFSDLRLRVDQLFPLPAMLRDALVRLRDHLKNGTLRLVQRGSRACWQLRVFEAHLPAITTAIQ